MGVTPGQPIADFSPVKTEPVDRVNGANIDRTVMSSSPPAPDGLGSPSKPGRNSQVPTSALKKEHSIDHERDKEGDSAMRSRSASMNANMGANAVNNHPMGPSRPSLGPPPSFNLNQNMNVRGQENEEDDGEGGFDLAKGFAPIRGLSASVGPGRMSISR